MDTNPATTGGGHRLFFALWPTDEVRAALGRAVDGVPIFRDAGRRTAAGKHHLTLHFLGGWRERPDDVVERARNAASTVRARAFHLVVDHAGGFTGARVGWVAPSRNSGLDALWSTLRRALDDAQLPYRSHESFSPHVTVLRNVRGVLPGVEITPVPWPVDDFVLVHSHDGRYDVIDRWALRDA
ncbi:RNA 2',3'-cyclic phosphodiesterase [Lysobacter claricitrinus]|uniref:RNA 2',3'-cyclic phosphodiesterase n=1 Tax=Lysobacter claricitrinus TaxID=3367728 RepID=UPI0037DBAFA0